MAGWTQKWTCAAAIATLAVLPNVVDAADLPATTTLSPSSGNLGAKLVASYSFTPKSSCSAYHKPVSWSFGNVKNWVTTPAPSNSGGKCTSSTQSIAPPSGLSPGPYPVCGTDTAVNSSPACATYTIKTRIVVPTPSPKPTPRASPSASPSPARSPSPSPRSSPTPGAIGATPSPSGSPSPAPPAGTGGGGSDASQTAGVTPFPVWPWVAVLLLVVPIVAAWRFRSWLMGVFENVEVLGKSGADLETELLHHEAGPPEGDAEAPPPIEEY